jgi:signal transduction histidine kinase/ligand-binding sensor domain-containing protein
MRKAKRRAPDVVALVVMLAVTLLAWPSRALGLDPTVGLGQYQHAAWAAREGLIGSVRAIVQTPDGYLWLGTEFGLVRFDGIRFLRSALPPDQKLPSPRILSLLAARDGTLWIGTYSGLASWRYGRLTRYPEITEAVSSLLEDYQGTIWIGARERVCAIRRGRFDCRDDLKSVAPSTYGYLQGGVFSLHEDTQHRLWAGAESGLWQWQPGLPRRVLAQPVSMFGAVVQGDQPTALTVIADSPQGRQLWEITDDKNEMYTVPGLTRPFTPNRLLRDSKGALWIGTLDRGLWYVNHGETTRFAQSDGLSSDFVLAFFEDREGNIWVGTTNGLDRFRESVVSTISEGQGLSTPAWSLTSARDGSIWIGTDDGVNRWKNGQLTIYRSAHMPRAGHRAAAYATVREITDPGLPDNFIGPLTEDTRGRIWVMTRGGAAWFENGRFARAGRLTAGASTAIAADTREGVWITDPDRGLLHLVDGRSVESVSWPWSKAEHDRRVSAILPDPVKGGLWVGFLYGGIAYFNNGKLAASLTSKDGLGADLVWSLLFDRGGALWAATDGGISRIKDGRVATLTTKNGLPCDVVRVVLEDDASTLWLYTACGLVRIEHSELEAWASNSKRTLETTVFDSSDGVRSSAVVGKYGPRAAKSLDGKLWFAHGDGVSVVDPRHLLFNALPPPLRIEMVTADRQTYETPESLSLPPLVRDLSIDYTALSFVAPEKNRFRVKLEGWDRDWQDVGNRQQAFYNNLPPSNYRFRVIACNNSGVWNEEGAALDFRIAPAYYQTNWFRALCGLTFLAMLWTVYHLRVRALEQRQAVLERYQTEIRALNEQMIAAQEAERMRISGELHDGVLQQITSLSLRLGKMRYQVAPDSEAKATVSGLQQQLIQIGTDIRHLSHELHPALLQESGLPAALSAYCEEFSKVRGLQVSCEADASVQELSPGAALCLYRIAQEALGNAAKYSEARKVDVRLTRSNGTVCLSVSDDGVGCSLEETRKAGGLGVINMRERVLQLRGTFEFDSAPWRGTRVKAEIPFRPAS